MRHLSFIVLFCFAVPLFAQIESTVYLHEVNISSPRSQYQIGLNIENIDSSEIERLNIRSLDELLQNNSAITIKKYGPGQLSTITLRGGSSYHTAVLWNGFQISSPLHGLTDLTLSDNFFFDQTSILYGGTSSLWGSGAVSGTVSLNNTPYFQSGLAVSGGVASGSFSDNTQFASVSYGNSNYYGNIKFLNNSNKNDFSYLDNNDELQIQTNSAIVHKSFFSEHYFKTGRKSVLNFKLWHSWFEREIPSAIQQTNSNAIQTDKNTRITGEWKKINQGYQFSLRSALFSEQQMYDDKYLDQPSNNNCITLTNEAIIEKTIFQKHFIQTGISYTSNFVDSSANLQKITLNRLALILLYRYQSINKKLEFSASTRKEYSNAGNSPLVYSSGVNYSISKLLLVRCSVSKVFRYPTINDLYWNPGGNEDLKPESGYSTEAGLDVKINKATFNFTYYYRKMDEWIIWYPSTSTLWRPQNLLEVKSRGLELNLNYSFTGRNFFLKTILGYNYTLSTNEKTFRAMDESYQKQLIYVPPHSANARITYGYKKFAITTSFLFTGYRYTTSDNSTWLDDYLLINIEAMQLFKLFDTAIRLFARVNNLSDTNYQSVANRPMPLRTISGGISINFQKTKK